MYEILPIAFFYVYGMIPFAYIIMRPAGGESQNLNIREATISKIYTKKGFLAGSMAVICELSKVLFPILYTLLFAGGDLGYSLVLIFSTFIGSNFNPITGWRGGRGVTVALWTLIIFSLLVVIIVGALAFVYINLTKNTYYAAILTFLSLPLMILLIDGRLPLVFFSLATSFVIILTTDKRNYPKIVEKMMIKNILK